MLDRPLSAGGFLWDFADEGVVRTDMDGWIDTKKNNAADGIIGPFHEKEGSYFTIKEIWSPVHIDLEYLPPAFNGRVKTENRYVYTNLNQCTFTASLVSCPGFTPARTVATWKLVSPDVEPGNKAFLDLNLPKNWRSYDILEVSAIDPHGKNSMTWTWPVNNPETAAAKIVKPVKGESPALEETPHQLIVKSGHSVFYFGKETGLLDSVMASDQIIPFGNGPVLAHEDNTFDTISWTTTEDSIVVKTVYRKKQDKFFFTWIVHSGGWLELDYNYHLWGKNPYAGFNFSFPEADIRSVRYLGDGPYRVWKNRMKGPQFGMWDKKYNNTITGESWEYPEFKGYYSRMYRTKFNTASQPFYVVSATGDLFLRLFTPDSPKGAYNDNTTPPFPGGDISFLSAISPIGTKFKKASYTGPQGELNEFSPHSMPAYRQGKLYFFFGEMDQ